MNPLLIIPLISTILSAAEFNCDAVQHRQEIETYRNAFLTDHLDGFFPVSHDRDYDEGDLQILQDIIFLNELDAEPLELGEQGWENERLVSLDLPWEVSYLPESFGDLEFLEWLTVECNGGLFHLPESFSNLSNLTYLDLY